MEAYHERRHHYLPHQLRRMDKQRSGEGDTYWANVCWAPALVSPGCSESQEAAGKPLPQDGSSRPPTQLKLLQSTQWVGAGREWRAQHVGYVGVKDGRQSYRYRHTHQESTEQKENTSLVLSSTSLTWYMTSFHLLLYSVQLSTSFPDTVRL